MKPKKEFIDTLLDKDGRDHEYTDQDLNSSCSVLNMHVDLKSPPNKYQHRDESRESQRDKRPLIDSKLRALGKTPTSPRLSTLAPSVPEGQEDLRGFANYVCGGDHQASQ